jgi:hypothetical protein
MSKIKQLIAEIIGDGKLFDEGLQEQHARIRDHHVYEARASEPEEARRADGTRNDKGVVERKTPAKSA